jgi:hypothetical protein
MTGLMPIKTFDYADQHLDDTQRIDSDGEGTGKDNARWRNRLYESNSASNALAELGSLLSFQRPKHLSPEPMVFWFLPGVLTKGEIKGTREIRVILYAKEPSYVPGLDTRVNSSDFAGAPPVA